MMTRSNGTRQVHLWWLLPTAFLAACSSDCVLYPCPLPLAADVTITAGGAATSLSGLTAEVNGESDGICQRESDAVSLCWIPGGAGIYQVDFKAPGFQTTSIKFTVTGTAAGCNTCGHIDTQHLSVVMQASAAAPAVRNGV